MLNKLLGLVKQVHSKRRTLGWLAPQHESTLWIMRICVDD